MESRKDQSSGAGDHFSDRRHTFASCNNLGISCCQHAIQSSEAQQKVGSHFSRARSGKRL